VKRLGRAWLRALLVGVWVAACDGICTAAGGNAVPAPTIVRLALPAEAEQRYPIAIPTDSDHSVELDFPWPVADWAGRGFTPDPESYAGDFLVDASRGSPRIFVTPLVSGGHRVLYVVLQPPGAAPRSVPLEFHAAPPGAAWHKVVLTDSPSGSGVKPDAGVPPAGMRHARAPADPAMEGSYRAPTTTVELELIRAMRRVRALGPDEAATSLGGQSPLQLDDRGRPPRSFGAFTLRQVVALRDGRTACLGLGIDVRNLTPRRLVFDPESWVVRAGDRIYPVRTVDFANEVEPDTAQTAWLVLARGPDGHPIPLQADDDLQVSVRLTAAVNPKPMLRFPVDPPRPEEPLTP
jgi:hypothetical protein